MFALPVFGQQKNIVLKDQKVKRILDFTQMRQIDIDTSDMVRSHVELEFAPKFGIRYKNDSLYYLVQGETDQQCTLNAGGFGNGKFKELAMVNDTILNAVSVLSQITISKEKRIYNIIPPHKLPARIITRGKDISAFPYNSRSYSCSMPYYDAESQRLYFCSDMPGGYGGWDIYYSELTANAWGDLVLLDEQVNTVFDELFPLIHNSHLLLFSSDGQKNSKGGLDNYAYNLEDKTRYHLKNFNTPFNDYCLNFIGDKDNDIYAISISNDSLVCYKPIAIIEPIKEEIPLALIEPDQSSQSVSQSGIELNQLAALSQDTVFFDFDSFHIDEKNFVFLDSYNDLIRQDGSDESLLIIAGSDGIGDNHYNYQLSLKRAESLKNYFIERGGSLTEKTFIPLILGECMSKTSIKCENERLAFLKASQHRFTYPIILAVEKKGYQDLNELRDVFNNPISDLLILNKIFQDQKQGIYLVGVKAIHKIKNEENLGVISLKYGITIQDLMRVNGLSTDYIHAGENLIIPMGK